MLWENYTAQCFCKALDEIVDVKYLEQRLSYNKY